MPRDPWMDLFFGNRDPSDRNRDNNNNGRSHDPFDDPFFRHFSDMSRQMDQMFDELFNNRDGQGPTIIIDHFPNQNENTHSIEPPSSQSNQRPHLSQINPNISQPSEENLNGSSSNSRNDYNNGRIQGRRGLLDLFDFDPFGFRSNSGRNSIEYQTPSLSDVNPDLNNGSDSPIMNDSNKDSNLVHPHGPPPGFRSPYLPNWNGAEREIEENDNGNIKQFYRSQSVIISTTPDGRTTKTTTVRDENGNIKESTETFDNMEDATIGNGNGFGFDFGFPRSLFDFGFGKHFPFGNGPGAIEMKEESEQRQRPSLQGDIINNGNGGTIMRPNDPFGRWRHSIDAWKDKIKGYWRGQSGNETRSDNNEIFGNRGWTMNRNRNNNNRNDNDEWFWKYRDNNNEDNEDSVKPTKIEWKPIYRRPRSDASKLRDQIIKPKNDNDNDNDNN